VRLQPMQASQTTWVMVLSYSSIVRQKKNGTAYFISAERL